MELRLGHDTGHGQQDAGSSAEGASRSLLASRAGSAWSRDLLVHQRQGYWCCWWLVGLRNTTRLLVCTFARSAKRTRCEASSSFRRSKEFLELRDSAHHSSERVSWGSQAKQACTTPACRWTWPALFLLPCTAGAQSIPRRTTAPLHLFSCAGSSKIGRPAGAADDPVRPHSEERGVLGQRVGV